MRWCLWERTGGRGGGGLVCGEEGAEPGRTRSFAGAARLGEQAWQGERLSGGGRSLQTGSWEHLVQEPASPGLRPHLLTVGKCWWW